MVRSKHALAAGLTLILVHATLRPRRRRACKRTATAYVRWPIQSADDNQHLTEYSVYTQIQRIMLVNVTGADIRLKGHGRAVTRGTPG